MNTKLVELKDRISRSGAEWGALHIAGISLLYFLAHQIAFLFPDAERILMAVWPASGIGLAALLLCPRRLWPGVCAGLFVAGNLANIMEGRPPYASLGFMTANVLESLGSAWLIQAMCGMRIRFERVREILALVASAIFVNAATSCLGAATACWVGGSDYWDAWTTWWVADGLGILLVGPAMLSLACHKVRVRATSWPTMLERITFLVVWCLLAFLIFDTYTAATLAIPPYVMVALLLWPALRFGVRDTSLTLIMLTTIALASSTIVTGPFIWGGDDPVLRLRFAQLYLGVVGINGLFLATAYAQVKHVEAQALEEHAQLKALGDNLPDGTVYQVVRRGDGNGSFAYVSANICRMTGVSQEEALRDPSTLYSLIVEEDRPVLAAAENESAENMTPLNVVVRARRPDGEMRWFRLSSSPRRLDDGSILWDGIQLDVTNRVLAEDALRQSEANLRAVFNATDESIFLLSPDGVLVACNSIGAQRMGRRCEDVLGKSVWDLLPPDLCARRRLFLEQAIAEKRPVTFEDERDGCWMRNSLYPILNSSGGVERLAIYSRDITERKRAEEALRDSEERHRMLFELAADAILLVDDEGHIVAANQQATEYFGYSRHELLAMTVWHLNAPRYAIEIPDRLARLARDGMLSFETEYVRKDGTPVVTEVNARRVVWEGSPASLSICRDLTQRVEAEQALRESEEKHRILFETAADAIYVHGVDARVIAANSAACRRMGYTLDELCSLTLKELDASDEECHIAERMARLMLDGQASFETIHRTKTGAPIPTEVNACRIVWNGQPAIMSVCRDITERKRAEQALKESEEKHRMLFECAGDAILVSDCEGLIIAANPAASEHLGYTRAELAGLALSDLDIPEEAAKIGERIGRFEHEQQVSFETVHRRKDGRLVPTEVNARLISWDGRPAVMGICRDLTERKQAEENREKLEAQNRQLQKAESLSRMAGAIAHHFSNQLMGVMGNLELALGDTQQGTAAFDSMSDAMLAARRASEVSGLMQTYLGQGSGRRKPVDLAEACVRSIPLLRAVMPKNVTFETDLKIPGPVVEANVAQVQQALTNLLTNAWEAGDGGPTNVRIMLRVIPTTELQERNRFPVGMPLERDAYARLSVGDNGCGIAAKDIESLFDPFFSTKFTGRGLGLPVVLGIMRAHGGVITVESEVGRGSTFSLYFPLHSGLRPA